MQPDEGTGADRRTLPQHPAGAPESLQRLQLEPALQRPQLEQALQRPQRAQALQRLLGPLPQATLDAVLACATPRLLPRGAWLFRHGEAGDAWYVLVSGRLAVWGALPGTPGGPGSAQADAADSADAADEAAPLAVVDPGEGVGELALLNDEPRSAGVRALRDCRLARIAVADFHALVARWPALAQGLLRMLSQRLRTRTAAPSPAAGLRSQVLALWPVAVDAGRADGVRHSPVLRPAALQDLAATLCRALQPHGAACSVGVAELQAQGLLPQGAGGDADTPPGDHPAWAAVRARLDALAAAHPFLLLRAQPGWPVWNALLLRLADRQLLLADGRGDPPAPLPNPPDPDADPEPSASGPAAAPPRLLVLLHPDDGRPPVGTARWLQALRPAAHLHIRPTRDADLQRLARALAGRSRGLVLSGGGARCFAQLGVAQAMHERGWPIDHVAGTSAGAMSAYLVADQRSSVQVGETARRFHAARPNRGLTLPLFSLLHGRRLQQALHDACGDTAIEDLWLPLAIVSSNLGTTRAEVHAHGPARVALLASAALPGLAPPQLQRGQLLFDGGLLNNLPVDVARRRWPGHVVAVDVCQDLELAWPGLHYPTPWAELGQRLRRRLLGARTRPRPPALGELMLHSLLLSSYAQTRQMRAQADVLLRPPLTGFGMLDLHAHAALIEAGYRHALAALDAQVSGGAEPG